jgi:p-cumate 2,3-dioxygenase alpha subunit
MDNTIANKADGVVVDDVEKGIFKVNRRAFTDPDILDAERRQVFDQSWLYVGHGSEIPEPGCFVKRNVGGRPLIFVHSRDGVIRFFFDTCTHRGNSVCRGNSGKVNRFTCFYHGWSFDTDGELKVVPDPAGYGKDFDKKTLSLKSPPRIDSYRNMYFMSMKEDIVDLDTYLGGAKKYIDDMLDVTTSEQVVAAGQQTYSMNTNWKLLMENSADAYHGPFTHRRFFQDYLKDMGADLGDWKSLLEDRGDNHVRTFEYGHALIDTPAGPLPMAADAPQMLDELRAELTEKYSAERATELLDRSRNLLIFPNLVLIAAWRTIRTLYPVSPDYLECNAWAILGKDDSEGMRDMRFSNFIAFLGPGGFGTPDDNEALDGCQEGFFAREVEWTDLSRGMLREGGALANDELQMRSIWRRWNVLMNPGVKTPVELSKAMRDDEKASS